MTNLEKFQEVFGIELDPYRIRYSDFICEYTPSEFCDNHRCKKCPAKDFWGKEYVEKNKLNHGAEGVS